MMSFNCGEIVAASGRVRYPCLLRAPCYLLYFQAFTSTCWTTKRSAPPLD